MNRHRLILVIGVAALILIAAGVFFQRFRTTATPERPSRAKQVHAETAQVPSIPSSEALIAAALKAGDLTYEESLLARAYALHDDPRLEPAFRSPIPDWEAGTKLFVDIDANEHKLSKDVLAGLAPFRVRPNDPSSIYNQPRADVVKAGYAPAGTQWVGKNVPRTNARIWIKGQLSELTKYEAMTASVWSAFKDFFPYPDPDEPGPNLDTNPDSAIDIYLLHLNDIDPRNKTCAEACMVNGNLWGQTKPAPPTGNRTSSAYLMLNIDKPDAEVYEVLPHELAHATQMHFDNEENVDADWLVEGSATWVAYKVMKKLRLVPNRAYDHLDHTVTPGGIQSRSFAMFYSLDQSLDLIWHRYPAWLFFYYASMELGDGIVTTAWQSAARPGLDGLDAVNEVIPFDLHFPHFTVRNWNQDPVLKQYKTQDDTFRIGLLPHPVVDTTMAGPGTDELSEPVEHLAARYYTFTFADTIRTVTFQNLYTDLPDAHVWAIKQIGTDWKEPEDWTKGEPQHIFCRDAQDENLSKLVIIISNTSFDSPLPAGHPKPRLLAETTGCPYVDGWGTSTLRSRDGDEDITYSTGRVHLRFKPRKIQDQTGNVQYDLMSTAVPWKASGRRGDCKIDGETVVSIPARFDQPIDPTLPAYGYMNVVGRDGGDFHSIMVSAWNPGARMKMTCPGDPPSVTLLPFGAAYVLHIISQPNNLTNGNFLFKGRQTLDPARVQNNVPMSPADALAALTNGPGANALSGLSGRGSPLIPPGLITPEIQAKLKEAQAQLEKIGAERGGKLVYTFEWELRPDRGTIGP